MCRGFGGILEVAAIDEGYVGRACCSQDIAGSAAIEDAAGSATTVKQQPVGSQDPMLSLASCAWINI